MSSNEKNDVRRKKSWICSYLQNNLGQNQDFMYTTEPWGQPGLPQQDTDSNWTAFILNNNPVAHLNFLCLTTLLWSRRSKQVYVTLHAENKSCTLQGDYVQQTHLSTVADTSAVLKNPQE